VTADNFPQWVLSGAKVAELRHRQFGPNPAHHPVLDVGYSALECPNLDWEHEIPPSWARSVMDPSSVTDPPMDGLSEFILVRIFQNENESQNIWDKLLSYKSFVIKNV
jgi:hypothetical protein